MLGFLRRGGWKCQFYFYGRGDFSEQVIRKKRAPFGDPETIRENQAIRANLRIDSRESGHLSSIAFNRLRGPLSLRKSNEN